MQRLFASLIIGVLFCIGINAVFAESIQSQQANWTKSGNSYTNNCGTFKSFQYNSTAGSLNGYTLTVSPPSGWSFKNADTQASAGGLNVKTTDSEKTKTGTGSVKKLTLSSNCSSSSASATAYIAADSNPVSFTLTLSGTLTAPGGSGGTAPTWSANAGTDFYYIDPHETIIKFNDSTTKPLAAKRTGQTTNVSSTWTADPTWQATTTEPILAAYSQLTNKGSISIGNGGNWNPPANSYTITATATINGTSRSTYSKLYVFDTSPKCPEIYMLTGHTNDKIQVSCTPNISTLQYKWSISSSSLGAFDDDSKASTTFRSSSNGSGTIKLKINDQEVYSKSIEIIKINPRSSWGANSVIMSDMDGGMSSINAITVHHAGSTQRSDTTSSIKAIQVDHQSSSYGDIGYHFVLLRGGGFYEGRSLEGIYTGQYTKGAHVGGANTSAGIGLLVLGDFGETSLLNPIIDTFTSTIKKNLEKVLTGLCRRYGKTYSDLKYHQMFNSATECPGKQIIDEFTNIKNNVKENLK